MLGVYGFALTFQCGGFRDCGLIRRVQESTLRIQSLGLRV